MRKTHFEIDLIATLNDRVLNHRYADGSFAAAVAKAKALVTRPEDLGVSRQVKITAYLNPEDFASGGARKRRRPAPFGR